MSAIKAQEQLLKCSMRLEAFNQGLVVPNSVKRTIAMSCPIRLETFRSESIRCANFRSGHTIRRFSSQVFSSEKEEKDERLCEVSTPNEQSDLSKQELSHDLLDFNDDSRLRSTEIDWSKSFYGLGAKSFSKEAITILMKPVNSSDVAIKPDGIIYLPEIHYRKILNAAFGPGGWGLAPRTEPLIAERSVSREYALVCEGRLVSIARGEQDFFDANGTYTALEGCKSNALMRTCKDLGIASELWDSKFVRKFRREFCIEVWAENTVTKKKKRLWRKKTDPAFSYPYKEA